MENRVLNLTYASSLTNLCEVNSSFDSGVLRIAYAGVNRNGSYISRDAFERGIKTIFNCPIVCNYDRESDTLGGHDMEVVRTHDGQMILVNQTTPVGCIPESANVFWETVEEDDGTTNEYLCADVLLWKRQEAYRKIKTDGIVAHSMEITVKDGENKDGVYHIYDFEFTAFALIGVEPCFESASLTMFSKLDFKQQLSEMMLELKESFSLVNSSSEDDDKLLNHSTKGGEQVLDKNELITKYGLDISELDFSIDELSYEELDEKLKSMYGAKDAGAEPEEKPAEEVAEEPADEHPVDNFALLQNFLEELTRALEAVKIQREWGESCRYWFADCDMDLREVYCWDSNDWLLYGFSYEMNGDNVEIDFDSKKRKKYIVADFDEGEQKSPFAEVFAQMEQTILEGSGMAAKYQEASDTIESMSGELEELREFKKNTEDAIAKSERDAVFAQFPDLCGVDAFETLKENCSDYDIVTIEDKCYAIRGRQGTPAKFGLETKTPKLKVEHEHTENAPYGGLFEKYGFSAEK